MHKSGHKIGALEDRGSVYWVGPAIISDKAGRKQKIIHCCQHCKRLYRIALARGFVAGSHFHSVGRNTDP